MEFLVIRQIGRGTFSQVFEGTDKDERPVAIKRVRSPTLLAESRELRMLELVKHEHCVRLLYAFPTLDNAGRQVHNFIMEYAEQTLDEVLRREQKLLRARPWNKERVGGVKKMARELLQALEYLHGLGWVHRDLKPNNILLQDGVLKLGDFGCAAPLALLARSSNTIVGHPSYRPPEHFFGACLPCDSSADMWAAACILAEISSPLQTPLFRAERSPGAAVPVMPVLHMLRVVGAAPTGYLRRFGSKYASKAIGRRLEACPFAGTLPFRVAFVEQGAAFEQLVSSMLRWRPHERVSASTALLHDFFL